MNEKAEQFQGNMRMNDFNFDDFAPDQDEDFVADLETISADAEEATALQNAMDALEDEIAELKARFRHLTEKRIPYAMNELGLTKFELKDGSKISINDSVSGSIQRAPDFEFAKHFLMEHDASDLLKTEVKAEFGKGEHNRALSLAADLRDQGYDVQANETVHPSTYATFGRELLKEHQTKLERGEATEMPPFEELGLFYARKAEVKPKKVK